MALTAAERAELAQLEKEVGSAAPARAPKSGLTPEEEAEMRQLEAEVGEQPKMGMLDTLKDRMAKLRSPEARQAGEDFRQKAFAKDRARGQAELEQFANAATMGYLPQLQAAAEPAITGALNKVTGQNVKSDDYVTSRDQNVNRLEQQQQEFPTTSKIAGLAGLGANALVTPGMGPAKTLIGNVAKGAAFGGAQGFLQNPGDVEGEVNPLQLEERAQNATSGAKLGALVAGGAGLGAKAGKLFAKAPKATKAAAEQTAFKGSGAMLKDFRAAAGKDQVEPIGRFMLDEGIIKAGDTVETVAQKATKINEAAGRELDTVYNKVAKELDHPYIQKNMPAFNPVRDREELLKIASDKLGDSVEGKSALKKLAGYLDDLGQKYGDAPLSPRAANDIKGYLDDAINYSRNPLNKQPGDEKAFSAARKWLQARIEKGVDFVGRQLEDPKLAEKLKAANKRYGMSRTVQNIAKDRVQRESANLTMGLTDRIAGGAGAGLGGLAAVASGDRDPVDIGIKGLGLGLLAAAGNKATKTYGSGLLSSGLNKAQPMMNALGAAGTATEGMLSQAPFLSRAAVSRKRAKKKNGILNDNPEMHLSEGYEQ